MADKVRKDTEQTTAVSSEDKKTASKETKPKEKKPGALSRFFQRIGRFFKESKVELKKIVWASPSSTVKNTVLVTVVIVLFAAVFFGLDTLFRDVIIEWLSKIPMLFENLFWGR